MRTANIWHAGNTMLTAVLSLTGAIVFGSADFLGGLSAKRLGAVLATAVSGLAGFVALLIVTPLAAPLVGGDWNLRDLGWGALAGVVGAVAIGLLYACLAIGPMSILSPLTALVSAVVPMVWGLVSGTRLGPLAPWALGLALIAVVLVGFVPEKGAVRPSLRGILMGIGSGIAIGAFYIIIDQTSEASGLVPLVSNAAVTAVIMFALAGGVALARRVRPRPAVDASVRDSARRGAGILVTGLWLAVACGIVNSAANALLMLGIRAGELAVAAVLGAMYPAGTILLAALLLKERIAPVQWVGLVLALTAAAMLALS